MNRFVHRMLGHYLLDEAEEGADLPGSDGIEQEESDEDGGEPEPGDEDEDGELIVSIGDEPVSEPEVDEKAAPQWARDLRKAQRDLRKENKELKAQLAKSSQVETKKAIEVGRKPQLNDDDIDYDAEKFEQALTAWHERKRQADQQVADQQRQQEEAQSAWQAKLDGYQSHKAKLKLPDFEDAESTLTEAMDVTQQGIIISGADNPALVVYALGKNPEKAKELSAIKDPIKFAFAIAKLETQVKTRPKSKPAPESVVTGSGTKSAATGATLDKLREDAERTGDYSKVHAFKRQQKAKERA